MYLADTNIISAFSPAAAHGNDKVRAWLEAQSASLYLSVVTVAEIESGIAKAGREGAARKAERLAAWLESVLHLYGERVLPVTTNTARLAGRLADSARGSGVSPGFADILIAALRVFWWKQKGSNQSSGRPEVRILSLRYSSSRRP